MGYKIPLARPIITRDMVEAAIDALQNEKLVLGESVYKFEEEFAHYVGVEHAVAVNSGTSALILAYHAVGLRPGQSFITTAATFISTASSGALLGATPIFIDIRLDDYTIDVGKVEIALNKTNTETRAITPVHLYGYPAELKPLVELASEKNLYIIEDAAQAHGALYEGRRVGSWGHIGIFSFYSIKNMTVGGDGGMLVTNDDKIAELARKLRDCGRKSKYVHDMLGYVFRLNTVNAAIGRIQLRYLDQWNERRRTLAALYDKLLGDLDEVITPPKPSSRKIPVYHIYAIRLPSEETRNALGAWLASNSIEAMIHYPVPLHKQPVFIKNHISPTSLESTEKWAKTILSLPMHPGLKNDEVKIVSEKIHEFFEKKLYTQKEWIQRGHEWLRKYM